MNLLKKISKGIFLSCLILLTSINFYLSCSSKGDGSECDHCDTDADCKDDMTCEFFSSSAVVVQLCAYPDTKCKLPSAYKNSGEVIFQEFTLIDSLYGRDKHFIVSPY